MKIKFNDGREYEAFSVIYHMDKNNEPIDEEYIVIPEFDSILSVAEGIEFSEINF